MSDKKKFRILSLDGGGSWALIQVRALMDIFSDRDIPGHKVLSHFDLAIANSGGSIVLGGLLANMRLSDLLGYFQDEKKRKAVFVHLDAAGHPFAAMLEKFFQAGPRYQADKKLEGLKSLLHPYGSVRLNELRSGDPATRLPKIMICSFDYDLKRAVFFRSDSQSLTAGRGRNIPPTLAEAIHASSNAPICYFDQPAEFPGNAAYAHKRYWDGAIGGFNNPMMAGLVETLANPLWYDGDSETIEVYSLGTGRVCRPMEDERPRQFESLVQKPQSGMGNDINELAASILDDPPDSASFIAHVVLRQPMKNSDDSPVIHGSVIRLNPLVQPMIDTENNQWILGKGKDENTCLNIREFDALVTLDMDAVENDQVVLIEKFCSAWMAGNMPNQPIQAAGDFSPLIGHGKYADGKSLWQSRLGLTPGAVPREETASVLTGVS